MSTNSFITRIAPTPSGYLHLGNAWSFLFAWLWARQQKGKIFLRIDAMDVERARTAYLQDIQTSLQWLGMDWDDAFTVESDLFRSQKSASEPTPYDGVFKQLLEISDSSSFGWAFACQCSRDQVKQEIQRRGLPLGLYPGTCRKHRIQTWEQAVQAPVIRWHFPESLQVAYYEEKMGWQKAFPALVMGDMVLRTRNGQLAYHLGSLAFDQKLGITHIVRGKDLLPSTIAQLALAQALDFSGFGQIHFVHHSLVTQKLGKLSKSAGAPSLQSMREAGVQPTAIWKFFAKTLDLPSRAGQSLQDLLTFFPMGHLTQADMPFEEFEP